MVAIQLSSMFALSKYWIQSVLHYVVWVLNNHKLNMTYQFQKIIKGSKKYVKNAEVYFAQSCNRSALTKAR